MLWPAAGFTKGEAIDYYVRVADAVLPHLEGRPLTLVRFPDGVAGERFYEKRCPAHAPEWVSKAGVEMGSAGRIDFCLCDSRATLVWLAQLAALELHPSLARAGASGSRKAADPSAAFERPTVVAFDLDPGEPAGIAECCRVALRLRALFANLGLECFPKTSGSKGLQVYLPLNGGGTGRGRRSGAGGVTYEQTKPFARAVALALERADPDLVVSRMGKRLRVGKVLVDWSQNDRAKTTVAVYSLRARERPWVSTPVDWSELEAVAGGGDAEALRFGPADVLERIAARGDLFAPVLELSQELPAAALSA